MSTPTAPDGTLLLQALRHLTPALPMLTELGERFAASGHELSLVGGPVRDAFLGRASPDLDFTTSAAPEQIEAVLGGWADTTWDVGRAFGTIGARRGDVTVEVTTYRADAYDGVTAITSDPKHMSSTDAVSAARRPRRSA